MLQFPFKIFQEPAKIYSFKLYLVFKYKKIKNMGDSEFIIYCSGNIPDIIISIFSWMKKSQGRHHDFQVKQFLGHDGSTRGASVEDYISVLKFNQQGKELAVGDNAGRVIIFRKTSLSKQKNSQKYQYCYQFQAHSRKFDILRSQEIPEKIKDIAWLKTQGKYSKLLSVNAKEIKLWKYFEHQDRVPIKSSGPQLLLPKICTLQTSFVERQQKSFSLSSKESFHSILIPKNEEYVFASTQNKVLLWNLQKDKQPYIYIDNSHYRFQSAPIIHNNRDATGGIIIKPAIKKKISLSINEQKHFNQFEKLTSIASHPTNDNVIATSSSRGVIKINDTRSKSFQSMVFSHYPSKGQNKPFSELTAPISKIEFFQIGKYIVARDFLTVKIWDLCHTNKPIVHVNLQEQMDLNLIFQKDLFGDTFPLSVSKRQPCICTGFFDDKIHILNWKTGNMDSNFMVNKQYTLSKQQKVKVQQIISCQKKPQPNKLYYQKNIQSIDFHPNNDTLAMSHKNCIYIMAKK